MDAGSPISPTPLAPAHVCGPEAHLNSSFIAEIGVGTAGFGLFFILLGILLYFDSVLLAFGNVSP